MFITDLYAQILENDMEDAKNYTGYNKFVISDGARYRRDFLHQIESTVMKMRNAGVYKHIKSMYREHDNALHNLLND